MYAGIIDPVNIPVRTPLGYPICLKTGYIYWVTDSHWDMKKKKTVDKRIAIGKKANEEGKMYPNKQYESLFGPLDPVVAEIRQSLGKLKAPGTFDNNMAFGPYAAMMAAFQAIGAYDALKRSHQALWHKMFAQALHAVVAEDSTAQLYPGWSFDNYAGMSKSMSDSEISRLYADIGSDDDSRYVFLSLFRENFHKLFPEATERIVAFDSTNQVTESRNQPYAKYGKSKTGEPLPIINTAMYVDQITGIPIWYEHFDGNVLDKSQTPYSVEKAVSLGYKKLFLMMDRGYFSQDAVNALQEQEIGFGMMMPEVASITSDTIAAHRDVIRNKSSYLIPEHKIFGCRTTVTVGEHNLSAYVFYDDDTAKEERDAVNSQLAYFSEEAKKRKRYTEKMAKYFEQRGLKITKTTDKAKKGEPNFTVDVDNERTQKIYDEAGFFMMLSNRDLPPVSMIGIGRGRDQAEKAFRRFKTHFNLSRSYSHNQATYTGKMFVAFLGLLMLSAFAWFCRPILQGKSSATVPSLIAELHRYKMIKKPDGTWMPAYALNRQQKDIFDLLDVSQKNLEKQIRGLRL